MENTIHDLDGAWRVTTFGIARPMNLFRDRKHIRNKSGYNIILGIKWGYFSIETEAGTDGFILNYDDPRNNLFLRRVRDRLSRDGEGWKGALYLNKKRFFDFRLDR